MKMKKVLTVLLAASMAAGMAACGGGQTSSSEAASPAGDTSSAESSTPVSSTESAPDEAPADAGGEGDVHIAAWNDAADSLNAIAAVFNAQEGRSGKVIIDEADGDYTKLKPALAAGSGVPDMFQTQNRDIPAFYNNYGLEQFLDVTDLIDPEKANFVEFALANCIAEDGKYYSVPWDIAPSALIYRTDVFQEAGIDVSTLTTYDKYMEAGKTLKTKNPDYYIDAYNFNGSTSTDEFMLFLNQLGGEYYGEDGKVNLASEEMLKATDLVLKMKNDGLAMDIPNAWDDRIAAINDNKLVALPYPVWFLGTMKNSCADTAGKWGLAPLPAFEEGGNRTANAGGSIIAAYSGTKNPQLVKDFLKFALMTDEGNDINMEYGLFPSYTPSYKTENFNAPDDYVGGQSIGSFFKDLTGAPETHFGPYFTDVNESLKIGAGNILNNGMDPKEAWTAASEEAQKKIDIK